MACTVDLTTGAQDLSWHFLHDAPRTIFVTELRRAALEAARGGDTDGDTQIALLRERVAILRRYSESVRAHGQSWPPSEASGHTGYPDGCGSSPPVMQPPNTTRGDGGWLGGRGSDKAHRRWGGRHICSIRVLTAAQFASASPQCLAALFSRPFLVRGGADAIVNPSHFQRDTLLETAGDTL
jgi:hypothetical protein